MINGHPDEVVGRRPLIVGDVARVIQELGDGRHTIRDIYDRYSDLCVQAGREPGDIHIMGRVMSVLGCPVVWIPRGKTSAAGYARGRQLILEGLQRRWPRLFPAPPGPPAEPTS